MKFQAIKWWWESIIAIDSPFGIFMDAVKGITNGAVEIVVFILFPVIFVFRVFYFGWKAARNKWIFHFSFDDAKRNELAKHHGWKKYISS